MKSTWFVSLILVSIGESYQKTVTTPFNPCDDFYDYVCAKDTRKITISNFTLTSMNEEIEVLIPVDNNTIAGNGTYYPVDKIVNLTHVMKWCSELEMLFTGELKVDYFLDKSFGASMSNALIYATVVRRLNDLNSTMVNAFYNALTANIEVLEQLQPPVADKNEFLDWLFRTLKNNTINELQKSGLANDVKSQITKGIQLSNSYFAFYDYNNITIMKNAKRVYETEYHRLMNQLSAEHLKNSTSEKIVRLGAIEASIKEIAKYIKKYDARFLFQAIVANPTNDAFQYLNTNHITIVTRSDLKKPELALADTVFVSTHEILHRVYPYGTFIMNRNISREALDCARREVQLLGNSDRVKPAQGWFNKAISHEDVVNIIAMRIVMKMAANYSNSESQMKEALETIIGGLCKQNQRKNEPIPHHHPLEISLNTAVRQYPLFSTLYRCRAGDRMFAQKNEYCKPLDRDVKVEDYALKNNKSAVGLFKELMNTSKSLNFSYGNL